ncbi:hypothetical protein [Caldivirga maquilingensis]|uniref:Uncharacterized protein n=1 Tax=Caldivirga maquilingensis (strain ATCC 700844 / DSM 13496 / JCM 10307 / IC-167) TaxID=397948 RepID=A8M9P4_CALMQ|nr:hypothetical protein [Caldivirga maquilingensis]ABW00925.1 conserved hypothetical protein [Caldivirga maquilingensis IC-167]
MVNKITVSGVIVLVIGLILAIIGSVTATNSALSLFNQLKNAPLSSLSPGNFISLSIYPTSVLIIESSNASCISPSPVPYASRTTANITIIVYNQTSTINIMNNCTFNIMLRYKSFSTSAASSPFITSGYLILLGGILFILGIITAVVGFVLGRRRRANS